MGHVIGRFVSLPVAHPRNRFPWMLLLLDLPYCYVNTVQPIIQQGLQALSCWSQPDVMHRQCMRLSFLPNHLAGHAQTAVKAPDYRAVFFSKSPTAVLRSPHRKSNIVGLTRSPSERRTICRSSPAPGASLPGARMPPPLCTGQPRLHVHTSNSHDDLQRVPHALHFRAPDPISPINMSVLQTGECARLLLNAHAGIH